MKKSLLFAAGLAALAMPLSAQRLVEGYIQMPESGSLHTYINAWNGGNGKLEVNGKTWEDEEFFISRVKPKDRFYNTATQVRSNLTQWNGTSGTDKRYLNWVPINDPAFNAIPNGVWDQEVFSMWSYMDHWGDWTSPFGWVPGAFSDVAHKNGVAVSGLASVPNAAISEGWKACFEGLISLGYQKVGDFLYYHGVNGLGYNSEWSGWSPARLSTMHQNLLSYMNQKGDNIFENIWYNGVTDSGSLQFDHALSSSPNIMKGCSMFMNYNWVSESRMAENINTVKGLGRSPFVIYAGMDQQGGQPKSGANYPTLANYQYSIGLWGAHSHNMFWEGRGNAGTTVDATQRYYLDLTEKWYTGGSLNPAIKQEIQTNRNHRPTDSWAGISAMMSARSVLSWDLNEEPFYTFFNIGNGKFFNWKGERVSDNEWYSIGIQDYMPTWRWWWAPSFLQKDVTAGSTNMNAAITWDDAYMGGSCIKINGTTTKEYIHLFKTNFTANGETKIRVTFKILGGKGDLKLAFTNSAATTETNSTPIFTADQCAQIEDNSYKAGAEGWTTVEVPFKVIGRTTNMSVLALCFENAENLEMLLGGVEVERKSSFPTPSAPTVTSSKVLGNGFTGVDGKIFWKMGTPSVSTPTYNSDVNTSMFKVYSQEEGGEPVFSGATTSWAAVAFRCPNTDSSKKIRFGVSAVSMDTKSESAISWGEWFSKGQYVASDEIAINKSIIKPGESFEVAYLDDRHASSTWTITDTEGKTVASGNGTSLSVENGLELGSYNLYIDKGTDNERSFMTYVNITSEAVGALPEVYGLTYEGNDVDDSDAAVEISLEDHPTLGYTGRKADGSTSRCLSLANRYIGCSVGDLGIGGTRTSISVAGWFRFSSIPDKQWNFMNISNKGASWPQNTWGWAWNHGSAEGKISCAFRGAASDGSSPGELHYEFPNTVLQAGVWTHIAWICEYEGTSNFRCVLYINGVKQESEWVAYNKWNAGNGGSIQYQGKTDDFCPNRTYQYTNNDRIYFGGAAHQGASIDGLVDDFQVWGKAMTAEDVRKSMSGITKDNVPDGLFCLWDFETAPTSDNGFTAIGSKSNVKAYSYDYLGEAQNGGMQFTTYEPTYETGCPFLPGTAYPVVTKAVWSDTDRKTEFATVDSRATTEGEAGQAVVNFVEAGDHTVTLTLENNHGSDSKDFPVFKVLNDDIQGIGEVAADGSSLEAYTEGNVLFLEFGQDGVYDVEVYNTAGVLVGAQKLNAVAGQYARVALGTPGVYLVKASVNGKALRTVKVLSK